VSLQSIWNKQRWQRQIWLTALLTCLLIAILISLSSGSYQISFTDWWQGLTETQQQVIWQLRLPRTLLAIAVGGGLALCGAVLQILLHNPVAEPGLIGISSGASLLAVIVIFVGHQTSIMIPAWGVSVSAFIGALLVTLLLLRLSQRGQIGGSRLLLLGVAIGIASNALTTWLLYFSDDQALREIMFWMMGSLAYGQIHPAYWWIPFILVCGWLLCQHRQLALLQLGSYQAQLMGLDLRKMHRRLVWAICFISGMCVALAGVIGFIGLVVPHLLRLAGKDGPAFTIPASILAGSLLLLAADVLSRSLVSAGELPVGVVTATIGAPIFIYLLVRRHALAG
jgi:vitamin B12 transport system permease protein